MPKGGFERLRINNTVECLYPYILKIISGSPTHAYTLRTAIEKRFGFKVGPVTCYKVLYLLKNQGLVEKTKDGRKKIYRITQKGKNELQKVLDFYKKQAKILS